MYVYSKTNRLKRLCYEKDKFENLREHFLYYFRYSSNINNTYTIDKEILEYIKQNLNYKELEFKRIWFLLSLPQTLDDFLIIYNKEYKNPVENLEELSTYLNSIKNFELSSENDIIDYLIKEIKNNNLTLKLTTYYHIRIIINNKQNIRRFQHIKKLCN